MKTSEKSAPEVKAYMAEFPPDVQKILRKIRATIRKAAPGAQETIKYGIPTFVLNGNLVHYAAYKKHIGFYPAPLGIQSFKAEVARSESGKGTLRFPLDEPIPFELIARIVKFRVTENKEKAAARARKKG